MLISAPQCLSAPFPPKLPEASTPDVFRLDSGPCHLPLLIPLLLPRQVNITRIPQRRSPSYKSWDIESSPPKLALDLGG